MESCRPGSSPEQPTDLHDPIDFTHADFAMTVRMENTNAGTSRFYYSYDRGHNWRARTGCRSSASPESWAEPT